MRRVFGTNSTSGCWPCRQVPLCSIQFAEAEIPMVAPYRNNQLRNGQTVSILEVLRMLAPAEQERMFGRVL